MGQGHGADDGAWKDAEASGSVPVVDEAEDPAVAFAALQRTVEGLTAGLGREMTAIRRGVETALARFEAQDAPADYSADLGRIVQQLGALGERLQAVERSPVLQQGAEYYALALERGGAGLMRTAVQGMERQAADLERIGRGLAAQVQSAHDRRNQDVRMWRAAGYGALAGMFLILFVPRFLPFAADTRVAALAMGMGTDRVSAGQIMIEAADPALAEKAAWGTQLYDSNASILSACLAASRQAHKEQKCTVAVSMPAR